MVGTLLEDALDTLSNAEPELREKKNALQAIWDLVEDDGPPVTREEIRRLVPHYGVVRKIPRA